MSEFAFDEVDYSRSDAGGDIVVSVTPKSWPSSLHFSTPQMSSSVEQEVSVSDSFMTADYSAGESQYFSVLDNTSSTILNDMTDVNNEDLTFCSPADEIETQQDEFVLLQIEGSDELFGIRMMEDEHGNLQKYQFKVVPDANGQLVPVPGTEQLVSLMDEEQEESTVEVNLLDDQADQVKYENMKEEFYSFQQSEDEESQDKEISNDLLQLENKVNEQMEQYRDEDLEIGNNVETMLEEEEEITPDDPKSVHVVVEDYYNREENVAEAAEEVNGVTTNETEFIGMDIDDNLSAEFDTNEKAENPNDHALRINNLIPTDKNNHNKQVFYLVRPEKENCLKQSNCIVPRYRRKSERHAEPKSPGKIKKEDKSPKCKPMWNLNKLISQTTIVVAPVRQSRLPRKQKIEKLSRLDEEIELQEIVVQSNGVIETKIDGVLKERKVIVPSECIQLSDDEYKPKIRRRKSKKKSVEIVISDSEEEETVHAAELKYKCSKCYKKFPSSGSLSTHMHSHTYEIKKKHLKRVSVANAKSIGDKYKCRICGVEFKNDALLSRHAKEHASASKYECPTCKFLFSNQQQLILHKRSHLKDVMYNISNTETVRLSPKKQRRSLELLKVRVSKVRKSLSKQFHCVNCNAKFSSKLLLDTHVMKSCVKKVAANSNRCKCDICGNVLPSMKHVRVHKINKHGLKSPQLARSEKRKLGV